MTGDADAAPGELELVRVFVNTWELDEPDQLTSPEVLGAWLREHGLAGERDRFSAPDLHRAREVREALRALLLANNGEPLAPAAVATLNAAGALTELGVAVEPAGDARLHSRGAGLDRAIGALLAAIAQAQAAGTWERLRACPAHDCGYGFYDRSRNHSRTWCRMASCGNREKARSYRERRRKGGPAS